MRRILVDHARKRAAAWRAQGGQRVPLEEALDVEVEPGKGTVELLELDLALDSLARESPPLAQRIEMRYFGGMTAEESAEVLEADPCTSCATTCGSRMRGCVSNWQGAELPLNFRCRGSVAQNRSSHPLNPPSPRQTAATCSSYQ